MCRQSWELTADAVGNENGGTWNTSSPLARKASRAVAITRRPGAALSRSSVSAAQPSMRCSQVSSTRRSSRAPRKAKSASRVERRVLSRTPSRAAIASGISCASLIGARSTNDTPSRNVSTHPVARWMTSRVLPTPPVPTRVTNRDAVRCWRRAWSSCARPTKLVSSAGSDRRRGATARVGTDNVPGSRVGAAIRHTGAMKR